MNEREPTGVLALGPQRPTNSVAFSLALPDGYAGTDRESRHQSSRAVPRRPPRGFAAFPGLLIVLSFHTTSSSPPAELYSRLRFGTILFARPLLLLEDLLAPERQWIPALQFRGLVLLAGADVADFRRAIVSHAIKRLV